MARKRPNGTGTLRKRPNGLWELTAMVGRDPETGKRITKSFYSRKQYEVKEKYEAWLRDHALSTLTAESYSLAELVTRWFKHRRENGSRKLKPQTVESYQHTLRHIINGPLGRKDIRTIQPYELECWYADLQAVYSSSLVSKIRSMLIESYRFAEANNLVSQNPTRYVEKMHKTPANPKEYFTADEIRILMKHLPDTPIAWSILVLLGTGLRKQELLGLMPRHIAEDGSSITIEQAVVLVNGKTTIGTPKSFNSYRRVPVPSNIRKYVLALRNHCTGTYILESSRKVGFPISPSYFDSMFRKTLEKIDGVRVLSPHSTRHSYISHQQSLGVRIETLQVIVGHADCAMTKHYLHVQESVCLDAAERFSQFFSVHDDIETHENIERAANVLPVCYFCMQMLYFLHLEKRISTVIVEHVVMHIHMMLSHIVCMLMSFHSHLVRSVMHLHSCFHVAMCLLLKILVYNVPRKRRVKHKPIKFFVRQLYAIFRYQVKRAQIRIFLVQNNALLWRPCRPGRRVVYFWAANREDDQVNQKAQNQNTTQTQKSNDNPKNKLHWILLSRTQEAVRLSCLPYTSASSRPVPTLQNLLQY